MLQSSAGVGYVPHAVGYCIWSLPPLWGKVKEMTMEE